ncbi:MAG: glycosyltransferase family A protein [Candidatus Krumholzibacteriia bacterium]
MELETTPAAGVSVIMPACNAGGFIAGAIASVLAQDSRVPRELIVVDDGSSDDTLAIVTELAGAHPEIVLLRNERRPGPSGARNTGLLRASGDYVAFLDADDLWYRNHLQEGLDFLERNPDIDVVFYNSDIVDHASGVRIGDWFGQRRFLKQLTYEERDDGYCVVNDDLFRALIDENFIHLQSMVVRRRSLAGVLFNEDIRRAEDRDFSIQLHLTSQATFAFRNLVTSVYHRHDGSLTSESFQNSLDLALDQIHLFSSYLERATLDAGFASKLRRRIGGKYLFASYCFRKQRDHRRALHALRRSLAYRITFRQATELAKLAISFVACGLPGRARR